MAYILTKLQHEGSLPVFLSLAGLFREHGSTYVCSNLVVENSPLDLDGLYKLWVFTLCPSALGLASMEQQLCQIATSKHINHSIYILHPIRPFRLPVSFIKCLHTLLTLKMLLYAMENIAAGKAAIGS
jgi:hypothetical protein